MKRKYVSLIIVILMFFSLVPTGCLRTDNNAEAVADSFLRYLTLKEYDSMYFMLTKSAMKKIPKDEFVKKYSAVFDAVGVTSITVEKSPMQYGAKVSTLPYKATFKTEKCGELVFNYHMDIAQSNSKSLIDWTPALIFPDMQWGDRVVAANINPTRGEIFDANSELLAGNTPGITAYAKVEEITDINKFAVEAAAVLQVEVEKITKTVDAHRRAGLQMAALKSYLPDSLTPDEEQAILAVEGMGIDKKVLSTFRHYPFKGEFAHLIGYVGDITQEDINSKRLDGYDQTGVVGRTGLEKTYDLQLRGKPGWEVYVVREDGIRRSTIYKKPCEPGQDLVLSIDASLQHSITALLEEKYADKIAGAVVVSDPATGEVIASASWPSFDPNAFNLPVSEEDWKWLNSEEAKTPLYSRFSQALLPPGSTYKPISALMGLEAGLVDRYTVFPYSVSGNVWYPNPSNRSWVIRRQQFSYSVGPLDMRRALVASDNIYFAWLARSLGSKEFVNYSTKFGMTEAVPFDIPVSRPQISNSGDVDNQALLLDSGYGQGELLVTPLQLTAMYGMLANDGTIMTPRVVKSFNHTVNGRLVPVSETEASVWKADVVSSSSVNTVSNILETVMDEGTGKSANVKGMKIAGKTGTAQLGKTKDREIGWYVGYVLDGGKKYVVTVCADGHLDVIGAKFAVAKGVFEQLSDNPPEPVEKPKPSTAPSTPRPTASVSATATPSVAPGSAPQE